MSTFVLGPFFLTTKMLYTQSTTNGALSGVATTPALTSGQKNFPGFIARTSGTTPGCELGGSMGTSNFGGASKLENNSAFPTINTFDVDHPTSVGRTKYLAGGPTGATILQIYKGTRPTISSLTNLTSQDSNLLISFSIPAYSTTNVASSGMRFLQPGVNGADEIYSPNINATTTYDGFSMILGICPTFTAATASGEATWFWFGRNYSLTDLSDIAFVTGDVGGLDSGADLKIHNSSITSGDFYRSAGFKFAIPTIYTV